MFLFFVFSFFLSFFPYVALKEINTKNNAIFLNLERDDGSWGNLKIDGGSIKYPIIPIVCNQIFNYIYNKQVSKLTKINVAINFPYVLSHR